MAIQPFATRASRNAFANLLKSSGDDAFADIKLLGMSRVQLSVHPLTLIFQLDAQPWELVEDVLPGTYALLAGMFNFCVQYSVRR